MVSTATVYKLIERGLIEHARVSNAIRIGESALARYLACRLGAKREAL
jgi:excisionase family DNA binding protein